jgi:hypothetical protein
MSSMSRLYVGLGNAARRGDGRDPSLPKIVLRRRVCPNRRTHHPVIGIASPMINADLL